MEREQDIYIHTHERLIKTTGDRFEGGKTHCIFSKLKVLLEYDYQDNEGSQDQEEDERRIQSLRDSQLSGPVRYSKMTDEEASKAFENR